MGGSSASSSGCQGRTTLRAIARQWREIRAGATSRGTPAHAFWPKRSITAAIHFVPAIRASMRWFSFGACVLLYG